MKDIKNKRCADKFEEVRKNKEKLTKEKNEEIKVKSSREQRHAREVNEVTIISGYGISLQIICEYSLYWTSIHHRTYSFIRG